MAELFSKVISGTQVLAGVIVGSSDGVQGINPIVDRLNSIAQNDSSITGSMISGTSTVIYAGSLINSCFVVEQKTAEPGDDIQGRFWIEV